MNGSQLSGSRLSAKIFREHGRSVTAAFAES